MPTVPGKDARSVAALLRKQVQQAMIYIATEFTAEAAEATPKDTGWARANWVPSIGTPVRGVDGDRNADGTHTGGARGAAGLASIFRYRLGQGGIWVTNNVPYVVYLNRGSSAQAPAGYVQRSLDRARYKAAFSFGAATTRILASVGERQG